MFLTMGGCTGASSCYGGVGINSSGLGGTPRDSMVDVRGSVGSMRKRSQLLTRDSGSSLGSESSVTQTTVMHHSQTYTAGRTVICKFFFFLLIVPRNWNGLSKLLIILHWYMLSYREIAYFSWIIGV